MSKLKCGVTKLSLQLFLDDDLSKNEKDFLTNHIPKCNHCKEFLKKQIGIGMLVKFSLSESKTDSCPSNELFADYLAGLLDKEETEKIEEHLGKCKFCSFWLNLLVKLIKNQKVE